MAERSGEHPRNENIKDGRLKSPDFLNVTSIEDLRADQAHRLFNEGIVPDSANLDRVNLIIEASIKDFMKNNGLEGNFAEREQIVNLLREVSYDRMDGSGWSIPEGDHMSGMQVVEKAREELKDSSKEKDESPKKPEEEKESSEEKAKIAEVLNSREIFDLRVESIEAYDNELVLLKASKPDLSPIDREKEAKGRAKGLMETRAINRLKAHGVLEDDPRYSDLLAVLVQIAQEAIDDPREWLKPKDRGTGEERSGHAWAHEMVHSMEEKFKEGEFEDASSNEVDESDSEPPESEAKKVLPKELSEEEMDRLREGLEEREAQAEGAALILADLLALKMKGKLGDESRLEAAYHAYNEAVFAKSSALVIMNRQNLGLYDESLSDAERAMKEEQLRCDALSEVLKMQKMLRDRTREAFLSNIWRKGVAMAAEKWNHENAKARFAWRTGLTGAAALGVVMALPWGATGGAASGFLVAAGQGALVGGVKGGIVGMMRRYIGKSSTGPSENAENDFDFEKIEKDAFATELEKTLKDLQASGKQSVLATAEGVGKSTVEARSGKNLGKGLGKGALVGALLGVGGGTLRHTWDIVNGWGGKGPLQRWVEWGEQRPSQVKTVVDLDGSNGNATDIQSPSAPSETLGSNGSPGHSGGNGQGLGGGEGGSSTPDEGRVGADHRGGAEGLGGESSADQHIEIDGNTDPSIYLNEGPYSIFDRMGIPRSSWEDIYKDEALLEVLKSHGDAYALTEQGHGFGWAHTGKLHPDSIRAIYEAARMAHRGNFDLAA